MGEPRITGRTVVNSTTIDLTVSLPNGSNLTTLRSLLALAAPAGDPPHRQTPTGFQIDRAIGTKRPIYKTTATSYPSLYRGTVTITNAGSGTGAARTGTVRIVMTDALASGDRPTYLDGQANAILQKPRDVDANLWLDMLIETVPAWRDTGRLYPFHGIPVRPQETMPAV